MLFSYHIATLIIHHHPIPSLKTIFMLLQKHWAIFISNTANKKAFVRELLGNTPPTELQELQYKKGALFSSLRLRQFIDEEDRHEIKTITANTTQSLRTMSSGEQKKALLKCLFRQAPE